MARRRTGQAREQLARAQEAGEASAEAAHQAELARTETVEAPHVVELVDGAEMVEAVEVADSGVPTIERLAPGTDLTAAAFFDVDNTMMEGASSFHYARGLAARKFFTTGDLARFAWKQIKFRIGGENSGDMAAARQEALSFVAGRKVADIIALGEEIYEETMADKIYPGTLERAQRHLDAGQRVWLITATPQELAQIIAQRLGLTGAMGTVAEVEDGKYTGRLVGDLLHGKAKAAAVRGLAAREGLDLRRCTAYSDSVNDVPMLSVVGTAVAVNPDSELRDVARRRQWQVLDYRSSHKAAKIGVPAILGVGAIGGAVAVGMTRRRRRKLLG